MIQHRLFGYGHCRSHSAPGARLAGHRTTILLAAAALVACPACVQMRAEAPVLFAAENASGSPNAQDLPDAQIEANVLKMLARAPELAGQEFSVHTVNGTVTLSGTVLDEARRSRAETLAANAAGVRKVVDELQLAGPAVQAGIGTQARDGARPLVLQSDGSYAPAESGDVPGTEDAPLPGSAPAANAQRNDPDNDMALDARADGVIVSPAGTSASENAPYVHGAGRRPLGADGSVGPAQSQRGYPQATYPQGGGLASGDSQQPGAPSAGYPQPGYPQPGYSSPDGRPVYPQPAYGRYPPRPSAGQFSQAYGGTQGQTGGASVVIPGGSLLRVRVAHTLASDRSVAGSSFDGIVVNDVVANGQVAIPRGAAVQGVVVDALPSGALKGRGELSIQLTSVTLGGKVYPIQSDLWNRHGGDKTIETVNKTAGFGAVGAVIGALAGGGVGAAVGGGIGVAAGLGSSATSGNGQVGIPAESLVAFHLSQPATVVTVSEAEMQRLASGAYPMSAPAFQGRPRPRMYVGPVFYPPYYGGAYGPYGPYAPYPAYGYPAY